MPVLKITHGANSSKMLNYLFRQEEGSGRLQALGGTVVGRDPKTVEREFHETRVYHGENTGRQYYHVAISFERSDLGDLKTPEGAPDYERLRDYGEEWARETGIADKHEFLVVVHGEKEHPHAHVIWNATGLDGRKYHDDKHNLGRLRDVNDRLARNRGVRRELDRVRDPHRPSDRFIRQAERGGSRYSWKLDLRGRIIEALRPAKNHEAFRKAMERQGVKAHLGEDGLYRFTFKDRHGLDHTEVSAARLYSSTPERITSRIEENAGRAEATVAASVGRTAGREAGGLVAGLMREIEYATHEPHGGRGGEGLPAREDLRQERPRHPDGRDDWAERR